MTALATDGDVELVARRKAGAILDGEGAGRHARPVVHAENRIHREALEQPVLDHLAGAAAAFLGGLEDQDHPCHRSRGWLPRRCAADNSMAVCPSWPQACIRPACAAGVRKLVVLRHGQGVDVGAQTDGARRPGATLDHPHHPGLAQARGAPSMPQAASVRAMTSGRASPGSTTRGGRGCRRSTRMASLCASSSGSTIEGGTTGSWDIGISPQNWRLAHLTCPASPLNKGEIVRQAINA